MNASSSRPQSSGTRTKETAENLLQAFQSYNQRKPSATPRPPSMSPHPTTPGNQTAAIGNKQSHSQQSPSGTVTTPKTTETSSAAKQSTPTPKAGKRPRRTPFFEGNSSDDNTSEEDPNHDSGVKRPRRVTVTKVQDITLKQPGQSFVENDQHSPLFVPETVPNQQKRAQQSTTAVPKRAPPSQSVPKLTPQVTVPAMQAIPPRNFVYVGQASDQQSVVQRLTTESKRVANDLAQKNSTFLGSCPAEGSAYFEAQLDAITKEVIALHQQKVDAVKGEYIANLQKKMSEYQKMISMLQQPE